MPGSEAALGRVRTGIAVRAGEPLPDVATPEALKASLLAARAIYFPDAQRSTAGIHFASVLAKLGDRRRGRAAPAHLPERRDRDARTRRRSAAGAIGCTQITEINYTPGIALVGALPEAFELATVYSAAVSAKAQRARAGATFRRTDRRTAVALPPRAGRLRIHCVGP